MTLNGNPQVAAGDLLVDLSPVRPGPAPSYQCSFAQSRPS